MGKTSDDIKHVKIRTQNAAVSVSATYKVIGFLLTNFPRVCRFVSSTRRVCPFNGLKARTITDLCIFRILSGPLHNFADR